MSPIALFNEAKSSATANGAAELVMDALVYVPVATCVPFWRTTAVLVGDAPSQ